MDTLITILARGGSKGVPNKALRLVNGKPLICWTLDQAERENMPIIVSSDSEQILYTASSMRIVGLVKRPKSLSRDDAPKLNAIRHAVTEIERVLERQYKTIIDLDICNPLRTAEDIQNAYQLFKDKNAQAVVSVTPARRHPCFNMVEMGVQSDAWLMGKTRLPITCRQDLPPAYDLNCCIYIYDRNWLMNPENTSPLQADCYAYVMQDWQYCDIDTEVDLKVCEFLMKEHMNV